MTKPKSAGAKPTKPAKPAKTTTRRPPPSRVAMEDFGPLGQAQDLIFTAWDTPSPKRRIELARQALALSPDCADAYNLLAREHAKSLAAATDLFRQGVEAGARALGPRAFQDDVGHFWGLIETRPYMRAMQGLAECLRLANEYDEAIAVFREMLRLNPNDNQGQRYLLASCLLDLGRDDALETLLGAYEDDASAAWAYTRALLAFRTRGVCERSSTLLARARQVNPHVPTFLLGKNKLPKRLPDYIGFGDETEAVAYAADNGSAWAKTPGGLEWLAGAKGQVH